MSITEMYSFKNMNWWGKTFIIFASFQLISFFFTSQTGLSEATWLDTILYLIFSGGAMIGLFYAPLEDKLEDVLESYINMPITLIPCGGGDKISADREQWSDGSNTVAIAPGEVIAYERNDITNEALMKNGIKVHIIPSSELSRGRGGPRCMCMPLVREEVED